MKRFEGMLSSYTPCFTDIVILGRLLPNFQHDGARLRRMHGFKSLLRQR